MVRFFTFFATILFTVSLSFSLISVEKPYCEFDNDLQFEVCSGQDKSELIALAAKFASNSYNLESGAYITEQPLEINNNWVDIDLVKPKLEKLKNSHRNIKSFGQDSSGIIAYDEAKKTIIVAFHGTQNNKDIKTDLKFLMGSADEIGIKNPGYAHSGFIQRYLRDRIEMVKALVEMIKTEGLSAPLNIIVTGHSLGGALATLAAFDIKRNLLKDSNIELVTFNSPRVFNSHAAKEFEKRLGNDTYRLWRHYDPVSAVPTGRQGFKHVGKSLKLPAVSYLYPQENHSLKYTLEEINSNDTIQPSENHQGWF